MKLKKFFVVLLLLTLFPKSINATGKEADVIQKEGSGTDIIEEKKNNSLSQEIIICSYGCSGQNVGTTGAHCGNENETFSAIMYNVDEKKWSIETNLYLQPLTLGVYGRYEKDEKSPAKVYKYKWTAIGSVVPMTAIYHANPASKYYETVQDKNQTWEYTQEYDDLDKKFICPQKVYYDQTIDTETIKYTKKTLLGKEKTVILTDAKQKNNNMELCYEDSEGSCLTRNETDKTMFNNANYLNYSFYSELGTVLTYTNKEIESYDNSEFLFKYYVTDDDI